MKKKAKERATPSREDLKMAREWFDHAFGEEECGDEGVCLAKLLAHVRLEALERAVGEIAVKFEHVAHVCEVGGHTNRAKMFREAAKEICHQIMVEAHVLASNPVESGSTSAAGEKR